MKTIADLGDLRGQRVLVRSDLNVPLDGTTITDDGRIRASAPTIKTLADAGARVIVCAHLGRPKGAPEAKYSLAPVAAAARRAARHRRWRSPTDTVGASAQAAVAALADGDVLLLENLRFNAGETVKADADAGRVRRRARRSADAFVSDGFGVVHRKQASVYDVARLLPHAAGGLVAGRGRGAAPAHRRRRAPVRRRARRREGVRQARRHRQPARHRRPAAHRRRHGVHLPRGPGPRGRQEPARGRPDRHRQGLPRARRERGVEIVLPADIVAADAFGADAEHEVVAADAIPADRMGLDIGPASSALFADRLADCRTVFWNGPMGVFEMAPFAEGTRAVAQALVDLTAAGPHRRRRRRLRRRRATLGFDDAAVRPHLHRRRRQPGVPRGQDPARARPCSRRGRRRHGWPRDAKSAAGRIPLMAGNWKMNLDHLQATAPGAEARLDPARRQARPRGGRGGRAAAVHRPALRADPRRRRQARPALRRAGPLAARVRRLHRRHLRRLPRQARLHLRGRRSQRAARVPRRGPTTWWAPR